MSLSDIEKELYSKQICINDWGEKGQQKLKKSKVLIAGLGGLGSAVSYYLTSAGIGNMTLCDGDKIQLSNFNRQIVYDYKNIGKEKTLYAKKRLEQLNPNINISVFRDYITQQNSSRIFKSVDIIVDCLDNFPSRLCINKYCVEHNIPLVYGAIKGFQGHTTFIKTPEAPCLECTFNNTDNTPDNIESVGATAGFVGSLQAMEVIKYLTGIGNNLKSKLLTFDTRNMDFELISLSHSETCKICKTEIRST
jgi:adenylyltransferase/sulfurtransferase